MIRVTVWNEFQHEKMDKSVREIYPDGMHEVVAGHLRRSSDMEVRTATLEQPDHGLTQEVLDSTDVLTWWGHRAHREVSDEVAARVHQRVLSGMGFLALHSAHFSKPFRLLMGTNCSLKWRADGERERIWNIAPGHPITQGIGEYFELPKTEMYGERFDIPEPDKLIFISWFQGGEVFRSGCTWDRGNGKVFYFRPGDQEFPVYYDANVLKVIENAVRWAAPLVTLSTDACPRSDALEDISAGE